MTYSRGKRSGPGLVLTAAAGYVMPSLLGAGAAWLLADQHLTAMLWLALVLLAATFLAIRNVFGAVAVLATAAAVFVVSYYAPAAVRRVRFTWPCGSCCSAGSGRCSSWPTARRRSWSRGSDADQLARMTGVPAGLWVTMFAFVALGALVLGASLLVPPGAHL